MTYPIQPEPPFGAVQTEEKPSNTLWLNNFVQCRRLTGCATIAAAAWTQWGNLSNSWTPWLFFLDQGFPVEYGLDTFNTPHTGTTLRHPQNWLCRVRCLIPLWHLVTISPQGNIFWGHARFSTNNQNHKITGTSTSISSNSKHYFTTRPTTRVAFSTLSHNSISSLYFFPFPWGLQHKRKLFIPCCQ